MMTFKMPKVSIVTISFNQAAFLERAIRSVLDQDYPNIEYIVVDPGSTDGSRELIDRYTARIARTILEPDNGAADGLNKGFSASTGDILGFLNSDDILYPGAVSTAVEFLRSHPDVDVVSGHAKVIGPDDRVLRLVYSDRMSVKRFVYRGVVLVQPSTFFRRSAYERVGGFNVANQASWDGELFLEMARLGSRFSRCDDIWSGYRLHRLSITASKRMQDSATEQRDLMFQRVTGRRANRLDMLGNRLCRIWKHIINPRDTYERILRGPVYGREVE
jgi:glycosyltransferase involved in cell wall biosynthesis